MTTYQASFDVALRQFGLDAFRPGQREVIESIVAGNDCMCIMPTGGGKSLCYQLPSVIRPGLTIVVSPLIALMKDQVDSLGKRGIPAALINSTLSASEQQQRLQDVAAGKYQLVYVAPERLRNTRFLEAIRATPIQLLAIDEAHCISQWGHDFRPDYTRIGQFREWLGGIQTVALTATATPRVRDDIVQVLGLKRPKQFMSGFARPNLHFGVVTRSSDREKDEELETFLKTNNGSGIIYAATRKRCEALVEWISQKLKLPVGAYHAGLMPDQRRAIQERFMKNQLRLIVATNAFGMGIDKPDLRFVIHFNMPGSLEAYYQEAGRAGRDGQQSVCVMLYSFQDRHIQEFFIDNNYPPRELIEKVYRLLAAREEDPIELTQEEMRDALGVSVSPEAIGSCLQIIARTGVIERLEMGGGLAMVRIDSNLPTLVDLLPREASVQRKVMRTLERAVGDRRGEQVFVHPRWLLQHSELEREQLMRALRELCGRLSQVDYVPPFRGRAVHFVRRDVPFEQLGIDFEALAKRKQAEYDRLNQVVSYAQSPLCRQATILHYFGDTSAENCGRCDRCARSPGWPQLKLPVVELPATPAVQGEPSVERPIGRPAERSANSRPVERTLLDGLIDGQVEAQSGSSGQSASRSAPTRRGEPLLSHEQKVELLEEVVRAIERIHGRIGKILLAQYLCGSQNSKLQKLNLHRLSGFGLLGGLRQSDATELIDLLLSMGLLRQQEVNKHRPTVSVSPQLVDVKLRQELIAAVVFPAKLEAKLVATACRTEAGGKVSAATAEQISSPLPTPHLSPSAGANPRTVGPVDRTGGTSQAEVSPSSRPGPGGVAASETKPDWQWTLGLFKAGHSWEEVASLRRMSDEELATSLCLAVRAGAPVERTWLAGQSQKPRTAGQQQVVQELRRQSAAWSN
jgi:ATP-dependent DNA helicase RecQ